MTRWVLADAAAQDLEQLTDFLLERFPQDAVRTVDLITDALNTLPVAVKTCNSVRTVDLITDALNILEQHPRIGRPLELGLHELVISRGKSGYLALYEYDEMADLVVVLAVRHQREQDYH